MVDEAHSLGALGAGGRGIEEHFGCVGQVDVLMGSLSKAVPAQGGYIAAAADLIAYLRANARGFVFSAALPAASTAAALATFELIDSDGVTLRSLLVSRVRHFTRLLAEAGFNVSDTPSAIVPILLNSEGAALELARRCPAVPRGGERLRLSVTCARRREDLDAAVCILRRAWGEFTSRDREATEQPVCAETAYK